MIEHLISISGSILLGYRTNESDYQYEMYFYNGMLYQPQETYEKAYQALTMGLEMIKVVIGYQ